MRTFLDQMPTTDPAIRAYLSRLLTIKQYAEREGISVTQVYRRISDGKAEPEIIGDKQFIVLPEVKK
ncbi:hypothetical protein [Hymenobacter guriensis]|uniref:DNA-binding protein n=1 Tax=Hymenobacter guriensis TaxID=2793065 RepID=A0ABS0KX33_9BACT|nr:hypothetical protein [Hymenobacter guriensis]MBG8552330.1 hypothetical protein [Hymenobacter guriensis]